MKFSLPCLSSKLRINIEILVSILFAIILFEHWNSLQFAGNEAIKRFFLIHQIVSREELKHVQMY